MVYVKSYVRRPKGPLARAMRVALMYSIVAAGGYLLTGGANLRQYGISLPAALAWYFAAAVYVGLLLTVVGGWATTKSHAMALGILVAYLPVVTIIGTLRPQPTWTALLTRSFIVAAVIGPMYARALFRPGHG